MIREKKDDLKQVLELYQHLHEKKGLNISHHVESVWKRILNDDYHYIIVIEKDSRIVSSCVCVIIDNLTREARPYAVIENVVTHQDYRGQGLASQCLEYAKEIAQRKNCYKMMLLTGSKDERTHCFYQKLGYNSFDKVAYVQWL